MLPTKRIAGTTTNSLCRCSFKSSKNFLKRERIFGSGRPDFLRGSNTDLGRSCFTLVILQGGSICWKKEYSAQTMIHHKATIRNSSWLDDPAVSYRFSRKRAEQQL